MTTPEPGISKTYQPQEIEAHWYAYWLKHKLFASSPNPDKEPYTIVIPPPNVTGVLHMGHMLNNTIQDILIRKARMEGKEALWVPGTDHASIATEARVVAMLKEKGLSKQDVGREKFLEYAFEWKEKYGGIILDQLKKLGASCDWDRTRFTMDETYYDSVMDVFVRLYEKGLIYRGVRMVNWDPQGKTALSDEEVIFKEVQTKLVYIKYPVVGEEGYVTIATVRPETIMADAAICVHPDDERYKHLHGKKVRIPLIDREIPIITDEYVTMDFGTGALKVTPAHDLNDYALGQKHRLPVIDILNDDGTLNQQAQILVGQDRFAARKAIIKQLEEAGFLEKIEDYKSNVGTSERTGAVIEPKLSMQWWLKMDEMSKPALEAVMTDDVQLIPAKFKNMYRSWMENVHDWCISRQLWWGQQIPAFYLKDGTIIVAKTKREALRKAQRDYQLFALTEQDLEQDPDVLDTWFSSWLWPFGVFDGLQNPNNEDVQFYYPTSTLVTGPDILFFWVARMIMAGFEFRGEKPFSTVYLTGIVRDSKGRKMSKSLGNSPDALDLIERFGADGVRTGLLFSAPAGNDLLFDEKLCEQGRNFCNKIWNAFRLVKGWEVNNDQLPVPSNQLTIAWFESKFNATLAEMLDHFSKFRISDALHAAYKLIWDEFCSNYLEIIKPEFGLPIDPDTYETTVHFFEKLMALMHPFMPFITEEIWQNLRLRAEGESLCRAEYPVVGQVDEQLLADFEICFEVISKVREIRSSKGLSPKIELPLSVKTTTPDRFPPLQGIIQKLANTSALTIVTEEVNGATAFMVKSDKFFVELAEEIDVKAEIERLSNEISYQQGFLKSVDAKLANEKFVQNAKPDVVERERQKRADAESKIQSLQEALNQLTKS
ncbi:MAG: valine--tRNA ligase [Cytophagaceae bacterium]|nr:valine--tRNA ligase [Cytophagaceae bacterium]